MLPCNMLIIYIYNIYLYKSNIYKHTKNNIYEAYLS